MKQGTLRRICLLEKTHDEVVKAVADIETMIADEKAHPQRDSKAGASRVAGLNMALGRINVALGNAVREANRKYPPMPA